MGERLAPSPDFSIDIELSEPAPDFGVAPDATILAEIAEARAAKEAGINRIIAILALEQKPSFNGREHEA